MRFFLFDKVIDSVPGREATGIKNVSAQEDFLIEHFPKKPIMPSPLIVESLAQLGGWMVTVATDYASLALMVTVKDLHVKGTAVPGDQIKLKVMLQALNDYGAQVSGSAWINDSEILTVGSITYVLYAVPPEERDGLRRRYTHYTDAQGGL